MKSLLSIIFSFSIFVSQAQTFEWAMDYGDSQGILRNATVLTDDAGYVYSVGDFSQTIDLDPGSGTFNVSPIPNFQDNIYISKLSPSGNLVWAKSIGGTNPSGTAYVRAYKAHLDNFGNLVIVGGFSQSVDFDPNSGTAIIVNSNQEDAFICKIDSSGNFKWAGNFASSSYSDVKAVVSDNQGSIYSIGIFSDSTDFDPGSGIDLIGPGALSATYINKLDSSGNYLWTKVMSGSIDPVDLQIDQNNELIFAGNFSGSIDVYPGSQTQNLVSSGDEDFFICKYDTSASLIWAKQVGGASDQNIYSLNLDFAGNIIFCGSFKDSVDFDPGIGSSFLSSAGDEDIFIGKFNTLGDYVWTKRIGGSSRDRAQSISIDTRGNIYTTGSFGYIVDHDPGPANFTMTSSGPPDAYINKLDPLGNFVWAIKMGGMGSHFGKSICLDTLDNIYTMGEHNGSIDLDPGPQSYNLGSGIGIFLLKLSPLPVSLNEVSSNENYTLFPNPTERDVSIAFEKEYQSINVSVFNGLGQLVGRSNYSSSQRITLPIDGKKGMYFLQVQADEEVFFMKILKE